MAPRRPPTELNEDAVEEILLRLPPDEPQCLFCASLVCKPWRRLLTGAAFLRRYRRFHRTPPLLGLFFVVYWRDGEALPRFIPTTLPSPFPNPMLNCRSWVTLDCRHGRVVLQKLQGSKFIVWEPITGDRKELDPPLIPFEYFSVAVLCAVLCAVPGCDHRDCHGGPFLIVWVCNGVDDDNMEVRAHACVYSSQLGSWSTPISVPICDNDFMNTTRGALAGDGVYFMLQMGARILKYNLVKHHLSIIDPPESYKYGIFIVPTQDGLLGVAGIKDSSLYLWSRKVNAEGIEGWMQYRVIDLQTLFPDDNRLDKAIVIAFAEGVRVIFMDTSCGISIIDLNTGQARTVREPEIRYPAVPFTSFYTPDCACGELPLLLSS